jgi:ubiquinone/menaquinone biosynthesis C-methylase UbiE
MPADLRRCWARLIRIGFHLLYHQLAWTYDAVSWLVSFGAWRDWQRAALPFVSGSHVLEIAHGPGHMLLALHNAGYQVVGIDLSPQMGALSRSRLQKAGAHVPLLQGAAQNLPFRSQYFDTVLVTFPTEFLLAGQTLSAVHQVLKDNGRFIIVPEAQFTGRGLPERFIEWLYLITGQRQHDLAAQEPASQAADSSRWDPLKQQFLSAGFHLLIHTIPLSRSQVTILLAQKMSQNPT